jgi:squalene cyclase
MIMDINKSIEFIGAKGSNLEKARINCIFYGTKPQQDVIQAFTKLQNDDGGYPFGMVKANLSTINETTVALWWMEELELLTSPNAVCAFEYLLETQQEDGSWDEDLRLAQYDLPPWIELGDLKTRLYLSSYATYWLAVSGRQKLPAFRKAIHYLLRHQDQAGKIFGFLHNTWIATGAFLMAGDRYVKVANLGIQALSDRPLSKWEDSQIAWAVDCLSKGGLPENHPFIEGCLGELFHRQKADGSWASEDGEAFAVGATIQVVKVLKRYDLLTVGRNGSTA